VSLPSSSSPPPSLVAFGEILLRLDPAGADRIVQARGFEARYTGAEANVAASLSGLGIHAEVVSAVPENAVGQASLNYLRSFGVGTDGVVRRPGRLGLLFHEPGGAGRAPAVIYDRAGSVFATCDPRDYDWKAILSGRSWLHISGTAPALGPRVLAAVTDAMSTARELGARVSLDLNFRASLWSHEAAGAVIAPLLEYVDVLIGVGPDAAAVFGLDLPTGDVVEGNVDLARRLRERFGVAVVAGIVRQVAPPDGQSRATQLVGVAVEADVAHVSAAYSVLDPVGRIGTGDAFAAGLLQGLLVRAPTSDAVEFAAAAAHLKQSIRGDINIVTVDEVRAVVGGTDTDRVRR
jgi:2-dehydro-3-deoxygluconokinase